MKTKGFTQHLIVQDNSKNSISCKKGAGFTIVELMVVISVITLLSLITIPILASYQKTTKLRSEARILATDLRLAQQLAITEQNIYNLSVDTVNNKYQIVNQNTSTVVKTFNFSKEVTISAVATLTGNTVKFNPTGAVLEVGSITLTNTKGQTVTVGIKPSGYVEISEQ